MEQVLDVYAARHTAEEPLICMDEAAKQLVADLVAPLAMAPGRPRREDHHYQREGTRALFLFVDPIRGWRRVSSREHRTRVDWAEEVRRLLEEDYPEARRVKLVCDDLNTHHVASLYQAFPAEVAHRLARRLEIIYTPRNGSWLNIAEIELSVLERQCLRRRFEGPEPMDRELGAWQEERNAEGARVAWRFTTADARIKLQHLYPEPVILE